MQPRTASGLLIAAALLGGALLAGCGGSVTRNDDAGVAAPPTYVTLPALSFTVPPGGSTRIDFDVAEAGDLVATLDWQDPANNVIAVFTDNKCQSVNEALSGRCRTAVVNAFASTCPAKPRVMVHPNYAPVTLRLWIANTGATTDSGSVALSHCREAPNCGATMSCAQCLVETLDRRSCAP